MSRRIKKTTGEAAPAKAAAQPARWSVGFANETVIAEFTAWPPKLRASLTRIMERIEALGLTSLTEEHAKQIRGKIWELRASAQGNEGRALYVTVTGKRVVIVLCEIKKTRTTPDRWIELAETRAKAVDKGDAK